MSNYAASFNGGPTDNVPSLASMEHAFAKAGSITTSTRHNLASLMTGSTVSNRPTGPEPSTAAQPAVKDISPVLRDTGLAFLRHCPGDEVFINEMSDDIKSGKIGFIEDKIDREIKVTFRLGFQEKASDQQVSCLVYNRNDHPIDSIAACRDLADLAHTTELIKKACLEPRHGYTAWFRLEESDLQGCEAGVQGIRSMMYTRNRDEPDTPALGVGMFTFFAA